MGSCCVTQGAQSGTLWWPRGMGCRERKEAIEEGNVCIIVAGSHCCMAETNKAL